MVVTSSGHVNYYSSEGGSQMKEYNKRECHYFLAALNSQSGLLAVLLTELKVAVISNS